MPPQKFKHELKDLVSQLDGKIAELKKMQDALQGHLHNKVAVEHNTKALAKVSESLAHAVSARRSMESSCCNQSCEIDWHDV